MNQKKVLVVDDDPEILETIQYVLTYAGYKVIANTGDRVGEIVHTEHPHLVLLDVRLEGKDGSEICRKLKKDTHTKNLPIIMFSAVPENKKLTSKCGSEDFIAKPLDVDELIDKIEMYS
jgi:DNA-binding response OmpR family regulator